MLSVISSIFKKVLSTSKLLMKQMECCHATEDMQRVSMRYVFIKEKLPLNVTDMANILLQHAVLSLSYSHTTYVLG